MCGDDICSHAYMRAYRRRGRELSVVIMGTEGLRAERVEAISGG